MTKQTITLEGDEIKLIKAIELLKEWAKDRKVGSLAFNFFKGGISSIKKEETVKIE